MVSNKTVFCLASLVVFLALAFVVPCALAGDFGTELSVEDVSFADKSFPQYQYDDQVETNQNTVVYVKFDKVVDYRGGPFQDLPADDPNLDSFKDTGVFTHHDILLQIYNDRGAVFSTRTGANSVVIEPRDRDRHDGMNFRITFNTVVPPNGTTEEHNSVFIYIKQGAVTAKDPGVAAADSKNAAATIRFDLVFGDGRNANPDGYEYPNDDSQNTQHFYEPAVYEITPIDLIPYAGVTEPFKVKIRLSERARDFTKDHIDVTEGTVTEIILLEPVNPYRFFRGTPGDSNFRYRPPTGRWVIRNGTVYYEYLVTIAPKFANKNDIVIKVKEFEDLVKPTRNNPNAPNKYTPPTSEFEYVERVDKLTVKVGKEADPKALAAGHEVKLTNKRVIPAGGYLIVATATADTGINLPDAADADDNTPKIDKRSPAELKYNAISVAIPNLEAFLSNGGTIDLVSPDAGLMISEIMWGSDASLATNSNSQWIEIMNTTAADIATGDGTHKLIFYGPNEAAPAKVAVAAVAETATTKAQPAGMALPEGVVDRVGTIDDKGGYWSLAGKGQSGRTGYGEAKTDLTAVVPTLELISMYRVMKADATGAVPLGNTSAAWMQSTPPAVNMDPAKGGNRIASPGADEIETAAEKAAREAAEKAKAEAEATTKAKAADTSVSMPKVGQIYISEVMFAGGGTLPQWIEISNGSRTEQVDLSDWTLTIDNATADADVSVGGSITFTIPEGTKIHPSGQNDTPSTILVVTERGRNNIDNGSMGEGQIINLWTDQQTELILAGVTKRRYSLLSDMAFQITLAPPVPIEVPVKKAAAPTTAAEIAAARAAEAAKKAADAKAALPNALRTRRTSWVTSVLTVLRLGHCRWTTVVPVVRLSVDTFPSRSVLRNQKWAQ